MTMWSRRSIAVLMSLAISAIVASSASAQPADKGEWSPVFDTQNVMIHASVLPSGKVLFWSRREAGQGLNPHECTPRIWNPHPAPGEPAFSETANKPGYNLFCAGHTFLPDGRLFVVGGHLMDTHGVPFASIYDSRKDDPGGEPWTRIDPPSNSGRWYPTAVTLPDGGVLVLFGSDEDGHQRGTIQVWKDDHWTDLDNVTFGGAPYYPRMHVLSDGRAFMTGPLMLTQFLDTQFVAPSGRRGVWSPLSDRDGRFREYAPSVLYDENQIVFIGGGNAPDKIVKKIDLNKAMPRWESTDDMHFARRQHNATILPDGTVLVMGGTQGRGGNSRTLGFNDLTPGQPIHSAELWDPKNGHWRLMARSSVDRCYHSIAVLLPDATVLSAGGGEYSPSEDGITPNPARDSHRDAQIFTPRYLFRADGTRAERPDITSAPDEVTYGQTFTVGTSHPDQVGAVNWVRLSSVTHSFNMNQRINFLKFTTDMGSLSVTTPANANLCPPGHYMLFVLNRDGVPSIAKVIRIH